MLLVSSHVTYSALPMPFARLHYVSWTTSHNTLPCALDIRYRLDLHVCSDSDTDTRQSTTRVLNMMAGSPVNSSSKILPIVTVSSIEAEYLACLLLHLWRCGLHPIQVIHISTTLRRVQSIKAHTSELTAQIVAARLSQHSPSEVPAFTYVNSLWWFWVKPWAFVTNL